jgi:hypothetical protein
MLDNAVMKREIRWRRFADWDTRETLILINVICWRGVIIISIYIYYDPWFHIKPMRIYHCSRENFNVLRIISTAVTSEGQTHNNLLLLDVNLFI